MDSDLLIPIFWTLVFSVLLLTTVRRLTKKAPAKKKWVRKENDNKQKEE